MTMQPVPIGDAGSLGREISPADYAIGWKITGLPGDAVALDTWDDLFNIRVRDLLRAIIQADAPTGLTLQDLAFDGPITLRLDYMVLGHAASLNLDLSPLFPTTGEPALIGMVGALGILDAFPHADHAHRMPSRALSELPVIGLDQMANAAPAGFGRRLGFSAVDGTPEYADEIAGASLSSVDPQPVGGVGAPTAGILTEGLPADHLHALALRSVGLGQLEAAPTAADRGRVIGFDTVTGEPTTLDPGGGGTFLSQTDTPGAYGTPGQATVVDATSMGLVFDGPYQPLLTPAPPTNLRATDAFDMALEMDWSASPDAVTYEWQRKLSADAWPAGSGVSTTQTSTRDAALALSDYDFRVRSVGHGGLLQSAWVELQNIPIIVTPTPAASTSNVLTRVASQHLRFTWEDLDVNNGGAGAARVVKQSSYDYQYREVGVLTWGGLVGHNASLSVNVQGLTDGVMYEMRVMGTVIRSDGTGTMVEGPWSAASNSEKSVKDTVTLTYGVADTRTGAITAPRDLELPFVGGREFEITNGSNPVTDGQFYVLDLARGPEYSQNYNLTVLETRPLPTDITSGPNYVEEAEPASGPRRYSVGPSQAISQVQIWHIEVA